MSLILKEEMKLILHFYAICISLPQCVYRWTLFSLVVIQNRISLDMGALWGRGGGFGAPKKLKLLMPLWHQMADAGAFLVTTYLHPCSIWGGGWPGSINLDVYGGKLTYNMPSKCTPQLQWEGIISALFAPFSFQEGKLHWEILILNFSNGKKK